MAQGDKPDYTVSAKVDASAPKEKTRYVNIGVAWDAETQDREPCIHVKLNAKPWGDWDGSFTLFKFREQS